MEQNVRDSVLDYMRQKYGEFHTSCNSTSYPRIVADITYYLRSHFPQQYSSSPAQASTEAKDIVNEICVQGNKFRGGGGTRGNVKTGWMDVNGRLAAAVQKGYDLGH